MTDVTLSTTEATDLVARCLSANGCSKEVAADVANVIIAAESDGCPSHGLFRVPGYVASLRSGKVNGKARPQVETADDRNVVTVDGAGGFAPPALAAARSSLVELASKRGIAALSIINVFHFSALWTDLEPICEQGLCALAFTCYLPFVAPAGGSRPLFGTNPMAFGWPRPRDRPMIFDQASSVAARGEVMIAARDGRQMRPDVGLDASGQPTIDPNEILKGAMLPFGGYKGSGIALMVELLAGALIGEQFSFEAGLTDNQDGGPPRGGELVIAMEPSLLGGDDALEHAEKLFARMATQPNVRLPADRRYANRRRSEADGITVPKSVLKKVRSLLM